MTSIYGAMIDKTDISDDSKSLGILLTQQAAQLRNTEFMDNCTRVDDTGAAVEGVIVKRERQ